jgi:hypothetical protein
MRLQLKNVSGAPTEVEREEHEVHGREDQVARREVAFLMGFVRGYGGLLPVPEDLG